MTWTSYCFKRAGFVPVGFTKDRGLLVLRRVQDATERTKGGDEAHRPRVTGVSPVARETDGVRALTATQCEARAVRLASDPRVRHESTEAVEGDPSNALVGQVAA